ncbi:copper transporter [Nocardiopsis terrae]
MIDFRYHLVSIVAVFLALTVGLVLGTTMLQDPLLNTLQSETADLRGQSEELRAERDDSELRNAGADQLADAVAGDVLEDRLLDRDVVLVAAPGADEDLVHALGGRVEEAGGEVVGQLVFEEAFLDRAGSAFVDELALQVWSGSEELSGSPYDKAGVVLGRALAVGDGGDEESENDEDSEDTRDDEATGGDEEERDGAEDAGQRGSGQDAEAVLSAFAEGGLLSVEGSVARSADTVVVVAPDAPPENGAEEAGTALVGLTTALHEQVGPAVLAGNAASGRGGGLIARARAQEPPFATVDVAGRPTGDLVVVLALAESLTGSGAAYGIGEGVAGYLPEPLPGPVERSVADGEGQDPSGDGDGDGDGDGARRAAPGSGE